jgi:response regulator NasT
VNRDIPSETPDGQTGVSSHFFLVVDDNPAEFVLLEDAFALCGVMVNLLTATTAPMALAELDFASSERQPDLALVDINMPMVSGFELAAVLIEQGVPTILMSTQVDDGRATQALRMGALDLLAKPFNQGGYMIFAERVIRLLRERRIEGR